MTKGRSGYSMLEVVVSLSLGTILILLALQSLRDSSAAHRALLADVESLDVARVAVGRIDRLVEAGGLTGPPNEGGLPVRAFRGSGVWCGEGFEVAEVRAPDPARDSVWWADELGRVARGALTRVEPATCATGGARRLFARFTDPNHVEHSVTVELTSGVVRWFERGRIRVDNAFRYGRDGTGAQPLTPAILKKGSRLHADGTDLHLELVLGSPSDTVRRVWPRVLRGVHESAGAR